MSWILSSKDLLDKSLQVKLWPYRVKKKYIPDNRKKNSAALKEYPVIPFTYFEILDKFSDNSKLWMGKLNLKEAK